MPHDLQFLGPGSRIYDSRKLKVTDGCNGQGAHDPELVQTPIACSGRGRMYTVICTLLVDHQRCGRDNNGFHCYRTGNGRIPRRARPYMHKPTRSLSFHCPHVETRSPAILRGLFEETSVQRPKELRCSNTLVSRIKVEHASGRTHPP